MDLQEFEDARPDLESIEGSHRPGRRTFLIGALATGAAVAGPVNYAALARKSRIPAAKLTSELRRVQIQPRGRGAHRQLAKFRVPLGARSPQKIS